MKQVVNEKIKFREGFRPFAPAVLVERVHEFFDLREVTDTSAPENFMLLVCDVRSDAKDRIPAVTHVMGRPESNCSSGSQSAVLLINT